MALVKRYFSFTDPITGTLTKGYGYTALRSQRNITVKLVRGKAEILKNEDIEKTSEIVPIHENVQEITEQEFNALDVSGESLTSKLRREREIIGLKSIEKKLAAQAVPVNIQSVIEKFKKVAGK